MKLLQCILVILLIVISTGTHVYFVWKQKDRKMLWVQFGIIVVAVLAGIVAIYNPNVPTLAHLLNMLSPFGT